LFKRSRDGIKGSNTAAGEDFDKAQLGELKSLLEVHNERVLDKDVQVLLERYDKDKDGVVTFEDFANEIITVP
jgi:Ca2+-binding EF-hand superfamily protein